MRLDGVKVSFVGAGHGGCAAAAYLSLKGCQVTLCKIGTSVHNENFEAIQRTGTISLKGIEGEAVAKLRTVTRDVAEALFDADVILVFYVTNYHEMLAAKIAPRLKDRQVLLLCPGYGGSLLLHGAMRNCGNHGIPLLVEGECLPFTSRIVAPGTVEISSRNVRHPVAALPRTRNNEAVRALAPLLGTCVPRSNVLESALHNPNLVVHTIGTIMNAAHIERSHGEFYLYREGFTDSIWNIVSKLDREKMAVMEAVGGKPASYFDAFRLRTFADTSVEPFSGFAKYAQESPKGPSTLRSRYVTEDVPVGLGLLSSLGKHLGRPTHVCDALITIASAINDTDYFAEARTVERLGFAKAQDLVRFVQGDIPDGTDTGNPRA